MAEYIERNESICRRCFHSYVCEQFNEHRDTNNKKCHFFNDHFVPAADVQPVVHGRWVSVFCDYDPYCSVCKEYAISYEDHTSYSEHYYRTNYCPNCGARMDGE